MLKSTFSGLLRCHSQYGSIFIRLAAVGSQSSKSREIPREFEVTAGQRHPRI